MPLTPIDVQQKTFGTALRGYDLDEVDDFLDEIVTSLKDYEQRLRDAQDRISTLESEMADRGDAEGAISRALVAAQRSADGIVEEARGEAAHILSDAQSRAEEIGVEREAELASARAEVHSLRGAVADMRRHVRSLAADLDSTLGQMDDAIDVGETRFSAEPSVEQGAAYDEEQEGFDEAEGEVEQSEEPEEVVEAEVSSLDDEEHSFTSVPESSLLDRLPSIEELEAGVQGDDGGHGEDAEPAVTSESDDTYDPLYDTAERAARPWEQ